MHHRAESLLTCTPTELVCSRQLQLDVLPEARRCGRRPVQAPTELCMLASLLL